MFANALLVNMGKSFSRRHFGLLVIYGKNDHCQLMVKVNSHSTIALTADMINGNTNSETTVKNDHCTFCEIQTPYIWPHPMYIPNNMGFQHNWDYLTNMTEFKHKKKTNEDSYQHMIHEKISYLYTTINDHCESQTPKRFETNNPIKKILNINKIPLVGFTSKACKFETNIYIYIFNLISLVGIISTACKMT